MAGTEPVSHRVKVWEDDKEMEILPVNLKCISWNYKALYTFKQFSIWEVLKIF